MDSACAPRAQRSADGSWPAARRAACSLAHSPGCRSTARAMHALSAAAAVISRVGLVEERLLDWFGEHGRDLPWRRTRDPYAILVSEVMLQQTQVERVVPRYLAWLERWPTVESLADASAADVIRAWQGLGYNRRGLSLHRAARFVAENGWPRDLTELSGVGPYTAAAVARFAFGVDVLPVDTNVRRVQERTRGSFHAGCAPGVFDPRAT